MDPIKVVYDVCRHFLNDQQVNSTLKDKVLGYTRSRNLGALATCTCHFDSAKHTIREWRFLRQVESFFKKNSLFASPDACGQAARESFMENELECYRTNIRLRPFVGYTRNIRDENLRIWVLRMRRYISNVLGDYHSFINQLPGLVKVTSGATAHTSRRNSLPQFKMRMKPYATHNASRYIKALYAFRGFPEPRIRPCRSNRVELVPKNYKTDRTIACEPEGNLPLQLAFDTFAKRKLRRVGINLSNQFANKDAARLGSINDDVVTVDFKAASDTIAYNTVSLVFPEEWFAFLSDVRTPCYRGCFGRGIYHKFSSMGNGSTFAIETLLFAAACYAVRSKRFLVYGDDVIIDKEVYSDYLALTRFLGFTINVDKTFANGSFRESCGGDYYNGVDVTPVYIRGIDKRKANLCHLVNTLAPLSHPGGALANFLADLVRSRKLPLVPLNEDTLSGVWIEPAKASSRGILVHKNCLALFKSYCAKYSRASFVDSRGYYLWFLNAKGQVLFAGPWAVASSSIQGETSWAARYDHAYVRKRVSWREPAEGNPAHLYWWTEQLCRD